MNFNISYFTTKLEKLYPLVKWRHAFTCIILFFHSLAAIAIYTSKNNYTGEWINSSSWNSGSPNYSVNGDDIKIFGFITASSTLEFAGAASDLYVYDTLIIRGDLTLGNNSNLIISDGAVLIVYGNVFIGNKVDIAANSFFVVAGNFTKRGSEGHGSFSSNDEPSNVFFGGTIDVPVDFGTDVHGVLNCNAAIEWPNSKCNYGDFIDVQSSSIWSFFSSNCLPIGLDGGTISSIQNICYGYDVVAFTSVLDANPGPINYQWLLSTNSSTGPWEIISGATDNVYNHSFLFKTTWFCRRARKGIAGCDVYSNVLKVTVYPVPITSSINHD